MRRANLFVRRIGLLFLLYMEYQEKDEPNGLPALKNHYAASKSDFQIYFCRKSDINLVQAMVVTCSLIGGGDFCNITHFWDSAKLGKALLIIFVLARPNAVVV